MVDEQTRTTRGWLLLGTLLLGLLFLLCTCNGSSRIQNSLLAEGKTALTAAGFDPDLLNVAGRDLTLTGVVPDETARLAASDALRNLVGVRKFSNELTLANAASPADLPTTPLSTLSPNAVAEGAAEGVAGDAALRAPQLEVALNPEGVVLTGLVPEAARADIVAAAAELYGADNVTDNLEVAEDVEQPGWLAGALSLLPTLNSDVQNAGLSANNNALTLRGQAVDEAARATVAALAEESLRLPVQNEIVLAEATTDLSPPTFTLQLNGDSAVLSGTVAEATRTPLLAAVTNLVGAANVTDNLIIGNDRAAPDWTGAVAELMPELAATVPELGLDFVNNTLTLTGTVPSAAASSTLAAQLQDAAPELTLDNQLVVLPQALPDARLSLQITDDDVSLSGNLSQATADELAASVAGLAPAVRNDLVIAEVGAVSTPGWFSDLIELAPQLANEASELSLTASASEVSLEGVVDSDAKKAELAEQLEAIAEGASVVNNLRVVEPEAVDIGVEATATVTNVDISTADDAPETAENNVNAAETPNTETPATDIVNAEATTPVTSATGDTLPAQPSEAADAAIAQDDADTSEPDPTEALTPANSSAASAASNEPDAAPLETAQVDNEISDASAAVADLEPPSLSITLNDDGINLSGTVSEETATELSNTTSKLSANTTNSLAAAEVATPDWLSGVVQLLPQYAAQTSDAELTVDGDTVTLAGVVTSEATRAELVDAIRETAGDTVEVIDNLQVDVPVLPELSLSEENGTLTFEGNVAAPIAAGLSATVDTLPDLELASNNMPADNVQTPDWLPAVVNLAPSLATELENAQLSVSGNTVTVGGTAPSEAKRAELLARVATVAGEDVEIIDTLQVAAPLPTTLDLQVNDSGVTLAGDVSEAVATQLNEIAPALHQSPVASVQSDLVISDNLETPAWFPELLTDLPDYAITRPGLSYADNILTLNGAVPSETRKAEIGDAVTSLLDATTSVVNNLSVDPTLTPVALASNGVAAEGASVAATQPSPSSNERPAPTVRVDITGDTVRLNGTVADEASRSAAAASYPDKMVDNALTLGDVTSPAYMGDVLAVAGQLAQDLERATLTLEDHTVTLQGIVASPEQRNEIGAYVSSALAPTITVNNRLTVESSSPNTSTSNTEDGK